MRASQTVACDLEPPARRDSSQAQPEVVKSGISEGQRKFVIIVGPTGVGKTDIGFGLAKQLSGEIISADSRLVYRMMDIGTAKPDREMLDAVPHHMIDLVDPNEEFTCKRFETEARDRLREILNRGKVPIVIGGSGLYVRALTDGIFEGPGRDDHLRDKLREEADLKGRQHMWQKLENVDPDKARRIDPENLVRVIRALEVFHTSGRPMSELETEARPVGIPCTKIGLMRERGELYSLIDSRVDRMLRMGLLAEVKNLIDMGYGSAHAIRHSLGYREVVAHLEGSISLEDAIGLIKRDTRHFAKRQLTWFSKDKQINWVDITGRSDCDRIAAEITHLL